MCVCVCASVKEKIGRKPVDVMQILTECAITNMYIYYHDPSMEQLQYCILVIFKCVHMCSISCCYMVYTFSDHL